MEEELAKFRAEKKKVETENGHSSAFTSFFSFKDTSEDESNRVHLLESRGIEEVSRHSSPSPAVVIRSADVVRPSSISSTYDNCLSWTSFTLKCLLWVVLWLLFIKLEFGAVFFIVSLLYFICTNLSTNPKPQGELSAYSVFNPNFEQLDGTFTAEQFEREMRYGAASVH